MKRNGIRTAAAAFALLAVLAMGSVAQAQQDPGPAAYDAALKGKRVVLIPRAMGFDLAQGWAYYLKREVSGFGGTFETRDPNWVVDAGAQAITEVISSDPKPAVLVIHSPDLNSYSKLLKKAQAAGIYVILVDNPANFAADAFVGHIIGNGFGKSHIVGLRVSSAQQLRHFFGRIKGGPVVGWCFEVFFTACYTQRQANPG